MTIIFKNNWISKNKWTIIFIGILLVVSYYYNYHEIFFKRPQSFHKWRQSDCASIALNYYQNGMDFFSPETHNLTSDSGTTGNASPSEIPLLYYTVALLYKIFGYHESIFRILNTLLFFIGLLYLFRLYVYLLQDVFWAIALSILVFTAPVLVFYGNNFLSNTSAFAFSIAGWYYFFRFYFEGKRKWFVFSLVFWGLAASFKITALFSLFAIGSILLMEFFKIISFSPREKLFKYPVSQLLGVGSVLVIIGAWIFYARYYNQKHDSYYFSTTTFPIWSLDKAGICEIFDSVWNTWIPQYFHPSVFIFLLFCLFFISWSYKKNLKLLNIVLAMLLIEVFVFVLLQFWTFKNHDYYVINIYIVPVILLGSALWILRTSFHKLFTSAISKFLFSLFVLFNIYYAQTKIVERYTGWMNGYGRLDDTYTITPALREMG